MTIGRFLIWYNLHVPTISSIVDVTCTQIAKKDNALAKTSAHHMVQRGSVMGSKDDCYQPNMYSNAFDKNPVLF